MSHNKFMGVLSALVVAFSWGLLLAAQHAHAAACPTKPASLTAGVQVSGDQVEIRELRRDNADSCAALVEQATLAAGRLESVRDRLAATGEAGTSIAARLGGLDTRLQSIYSRQADPVALTRGASSASPLYTHAASSGSSSTADHGQTDDDPTYVRLATASTSWIEDRGKPLLFGVGAIFGAVLCAGILALLRRSWGL